MNCTLFVPHLILPREFGDDIHRELALAELQTLLARATRSTMPELDETAWLCRAFGIDKQRDWPVAPITLAADGGEPGARYWLRADPIHLVAQRDALIFGDPAQLALIQDESTALAGTLAEHLRADNVTFIAPRPDRWYLGLDNAADIETVPIVAAQGRDIRERMPRGNDAMRWHRVATELQMLLHAHGVNDARETRGLLPVNSVWLWGGGTLAPSASSVYRQVWSDDALTYGLARHAHCACAALPPSASAWLASANPTTRNTEHLVVLDTLRMPALAGDIAAWRAALETLNRLWFAPLLAALKSRTVARLSVVTQTSGGMQRFDAGVWSLHKFWCRNIYLHNYT